MTRQGKRWSPASLISTPTARWVGGVPGHGPVPVPEAAQTDLPGAADFLHANGDAPAGFQQKTVAMEEGKLRLLPPDAPVSGEVYDAAGKKVVPGARNGPSR